MDSVLRDGEENTDTRYAIYTPPTLPSPDTFTQNTSSHCTYADTHGHIDTHRHTYTRPRSIHPSHLLPSFIFLARPASRSGSPSHVCAGRFSCCLRRSSILAVAPANSFGLPLCLSDVHGRLSRCSRAGCGCGRCSLVVMVDLPPSSALTLDTCSAEGQKACEHSRNSLAVPSSPIPGARPSSQNPQSR